MTGTETAAAGERAGHCPWLRATGGAIVPPAPIPHTVLPGPVTLYRALRRNPLTVWTREHYEAEAIVNVTPIGRRIVVNGPDAVGHVLVDNAGNYAKDAMQLGILRRFAGDSLFTADGARWKRHRQALAPVFTPARVAACEPAFVAAASRCCRRLERAADAGETVALLNEMATTAVDALADALFDDGLGDAPERIAQRSDAMMRHATRIGLADIATAPAWVPRWSRIRSRRHKAYFERLAEAILARGALSGPVSPVVSALTTSRGAADALAHLERRDNVAMLIGAGHETVSETLAWALYLLSLAPEAADAIADEAARESRQDGNTRTSLPLTRAVIEETMRLYPPAPTLTRVALGRDRVAGIDIVPGDVIVVSPWLVHRHRALWDAPEAFDPTRFLGSARESIHRFAYLPFGAGPRICIGMGFAMLEAEIVLARLVRNFRFSLAEGQTIEPLQRVTLRPRLDIRMKVARRA